MDFYHGITKGKGGKMGETLYLVIPCYNEEAVLPETAKRLKEKIKNLITGGVIDEKSKIMFVNDGSKDKTWSIIEQLHNQDSIFSGVNLSRNRGHQNALLAGLMTAKNYADITISLDADLQDDINAIDQFVNKYKEGYDIVYGVRSKREKDSPFKRNTALAFYKLQALMGVHSVYNHADYRLMSKRALEALEQFKEVNLFLRGIVPLIGFQSTEVMYERNERFAGESKYPLKKMLAFAIDGITSFSIKPIRFITGLGILIFIGSIFVILYSVIRKVMGYTVSGWAFLSCSIWLLGGIQLFGLGVVGEYIGKIYNEVKERPKYIIEKILND